MVKVLKDWKGMVITIITTVIITTATLLITLHVDNVYEKERIADHEQRIELLEKNDVENRISIKNNYEKILENEKDILKVQNEMLENRNTLNNINDNIFEIMKILREDQILINKSMQHNNNQNKNGGK